MNKITYKEKLQKIIKDNNWSQREMGKRIGVSQGTISVWLRGVDITKKQWKDRVDELYFGKVQQTKTTEIEKLEIKLQIKDETIGRLLQQIRDWQNAYYRLKDMWRNDFNKTMKEKRNKKIARKIVQKISVDLGLNNIYYKTIMQEDLVRCLNEIISKNS